MFWWYWMNIFILRTIMTTSEDAIWISVRNNPSREKLVWYFKGVKDRICVCVNVESCLHIFYAAIHGHTCIETINAQVNNIYNVQSLVTSSSIFYFLCDAEGRLTRSECKIAYWYIWIYEFINVILFYFFYFVCHCAWIFYDEIRMKFSDELSPSIRVKGIIVVLCRGWNLRVGESWK